MATIVTKFSDYILHSIEYFITQIETELAYRDIKGLSNDTIELINVTKEHPLVTLMTAQLAENRNADPLQSGLLPAISVTPGNASDKAFTLGQSLKPEIVNSEFISNLTEYLNKNTKEIQEDLLITHGQIETIIAEYARVAAGGMRSQKNEWFKDEEINISVWSKSPDIDILLGNLMDAVLATIQVGFVGDDSKLRDFSYKISKGLTNFNFGRTLFGSEYNLTFLNSYNNYIIYTDDVISGHDLEGTFLIPGEEE